MKRFFAILIALAAGGCGSMPERYIPSATGPIGAPEVVRGLSVSIAAASDAVAFGQPVFFDITISNASRMVYWLPREPQIIFAWTYANGRRDNLIRDPLEDRYFTQYAASKIFPGEVRKHQTKIPTGYFPAKGITEFKAIYTSPRNTNPELMPFWNGEILSNAYGVDIKGRKYTGRH
ncbi:MAG TPA: hypothetical protein PKM67_00590 [Kiritimatiellia bacterium]|nr:hypothetical protein [Kiritimatiellia bacterium]HNR93512.1 hypothetical protein [Kiritimatiellia bacterium]HNS79939.1 hypothetical protein [Kiritimatiellia bacterium]HPA77806.1 hypothetical protein [Kiritimatiellia bacterium]HQQ04357.1 hypothetical protein [Kiritimatiellia bacterium]